MNREAFLAEQQRYFEGSFDQFRTFGGPSLYFHQQCIREGERNFLSERHVELLYATLTAWGMHRMGGDTKLSDWPTFSSSVHNTRETLLPLREVAATTVDAVQYGAILNAIAPAYQSLQLSMSSATLVVNSKALHHLLPNLIPPMDRQYTVRFFTQLPGLWKNPNGKYTTISLPTDKAKQFELFCGLARKTHALAQGVEPALFEQQRVAHSVSALKALDNAIVNYIKIVSAGAR